MRPQLLFEHFFDIISNFGSVQLENESTFHYSTIQHLKHINLWSSLALLLREIDMCAPLHFCTKFNVQQLKFEQFFDLIGNLKLRIHLRTFCLQMDPVTP